MRTRQNFDAMLSLSHSARFGKIEAIVTIVPIPMTRIAPLTWHVIAPISFIYIDMRLFMYVLLPLRHFSVGGMRPAIALHVGRLGIA